MHSILGLTVEQIQNELQVYGIKKYRAKQIVSWIYKKSVASFSQMTDISVNERKIFDSIWCVDCGVVVRHQKSKDNITDKFLAELADGNFVEFVIMRQKFGNSVCISSQCGCAMGCKFCASGLNGWQRNLTVAEMLWQVWWTQKYLQKLGVNLNSVLVMGCGEPLDNYENLIMWLRAMHDEQQIAMSYRSITVSTVGIVENIKKLIELNLPINLAISLHATNDEMRKRIMPIARKYSIKDVIDIADEFTRITGRRVSYEYIMIKDYNDNEKYASELAELMKGRIAHVNLIPANVNIRSDYHRSDEKKIQAFVDCLRQQSVNVTVRKSRGADIDAACGQLQIKYVGERV